MSDYTNVSARAMLVSVSISTWTARKFDKKATDKVNTDAEADRRASRVNKDLLVGAAELERVLTAAGAARNEHYVQTLPWSDEGWRLLPTANYLDYTKRMRVAKCQFELAVAAFVDAYPTLREQARKKLGKLWDAGDYPSATDIRERFQWAIEVNPVPDAGDLRVDLPGDALKRIEQGITARVEGSVRAAMDDAWKRLFEAVNRIKDTLSKEEPRIYDTLIGNARELVDVLKRLNVANDPGLEKMRKQVERELAGLDTDDLRGSDPEVKALREATAKKASQIMDAMAAFYTPDGGEEAA